MTLKSIFFDKHFWKKALPIAIPIAFQNLLSASFAMVDTIMVSSLGGQVLSAVGMAGQLSWIVNSLIFGIASGTGIFVAQYWGAGDKDSIHRTEGIALSLMAVSTVLFSVFGFIFADKFMGIYSDNPQTVAIGVSYIKYACWSYIPNSICYALCIIIRSTESPTLPVVISSINAGLNVVLNYCLIYGHFFFPEMGAAGAALATSISNWLALVILLVICYTKKSIIIAPAKKLFSFNFHNIKDYFSKTLLTLFNEVFWSIGVVVVNAIFSKFGDDCYAGVTINTTLSNLAFVFSVGLCSACSILVGQNIGVGNIKAAKEDSVRFSFIMPVFGILTSALIILLSSPIVSLFTINGNYSNEAVKAALFCVCAYSAILPVRNIPYLYIVGIFRPGGDPISGMICDLLSFWFVSIPITLTLLHFFTIPFEVVFIMIYALEDIPKLLIGTAYFISDKWIRPVTDEGKAGLKQYIEAKKLDKAKKNMVK